MSDDVQNQPESSSNEAEHISPTSRAMEQEHQEQPKEGSAEHAAAPVTGSGAGDEVVSPEQTVRQPEDTSEPAPPAGGSSTGERKGSTPSREPRNDRNRRRPDNRRGGHDSRGRRGPQQRAIKRFVAVTWSSQREPADNMFWAEAEREGDWVMFHTLEQVRTRREILERLQELNEGLVGLEFHFSYPKPFIDFLANEQPIGDWRHLLTQVREDLKKNSEDGIRLWIERMGRYREAHLDPNAPMNQRGDRGGRRDRRGPLEPYEQRSTAERFRRTDLTLRRAAEQQLVSPIQIGYNRLTSRYEFNDPNVRGRGALLGMSMLAQLLDGRSDIAVWPFEKPKALTIVELQPWIFTKGKMMSPEEMRKVMALHEDAGWDFPAQVRDMAARNADAQRALRSVMGMIKTETREERANRPLRDYQEVFYQDPQIHLEGWFYGVGYRPANAPGGNTPGADAPEHEEGRSERESASHRTEKEDVDKKAAGETAQQGTAATTSNVNIPTSTHVVEATSESDRGAQAGDDPAVGANQIVNEADAEQIEALPTPSAAEIHRAE